MWLHTYDVCACVCDAFYCTTWKDECTWNKSGLFEIWH